MQNQAKLYLLCFLHQTTTETCVSKYVVKLYLLCFLHQTTTSFISQSFFTCCISYVFYIKPQLKRNLSLKSFSCISYVFYIKPQLVPGYQFQKTVVSLMFSTSNHNFTVASLDLYRLYLLCFLHQTTTSIMRYQCLTSCISYVFYIKPQLLVDIVVFNNVVSLMFSTSNHNFLLSCFGINLLYLLCFLHQTTTRYKKLHKLPLLYLLCFLHQTTTRIHIRDINFGCISYVFYIKPQLGNTGTSEYSGCISYVFYIKPQRMYIIFLIISCL